LRQQVNSPEHAALSARQRAARKRAAAEKVKRLEQAIAQLPELKQKHAQSERRAGAGKQGEKVRQRHPRVSTTDAQARVMKMPNGGFNPAVNVQLATDTESRAILGVDVTNSGSDSVGLSAPMRQQVEQRTGGKVQQHLVDGGYLRKDDIEQADAKGVELFVPPKGAKTPETGAMNWSPNAETAQRWCDGSNACPARKGKRFTSSAQPPVKPSTPTSEPIAA
jgi:hypothetical protein